jgi:hypothetical protein
MPGVDAPCNPSLTSQGRFENPVRRRKYRIGDNYTHSSGSPEVQADLRILLEYDFQEL